MYGLLSESAQAVLGTFKGARAARDSGLGRTDAVCSPVTLNSRTGPDGARCDLAYFAVGATPKLMGLMAAQYNPGSQREGHIQLRHIQPGFAPCAIQSTAYLMKQNERMIRDPLAVDDGAIVAEREGMQSIRKGPTGIRAQN